MNKRDITYFPSKILLFGEYTVTIGGTAIALPFEKFYGKWSFNPLRDNKTLHDLAVYLNEIDWKGYKSEFYYSGFVSDLEEGLYFESNIKTGFGVGSSGALCAGIFDRFFKVHDNNIQNLNRILAKIESYFHGVSSGIDPLVSLLNRAVKIAENGFEIYEKNISQFKDFNFYLLDSNVSRSTRKFVNIFKEKMKSGTFKNKILNPLMESNNDIANEFMESNENTVYELFNSISGLQFHGFKEMILPELLPVWKNILSQEDISIKLCGAGGGGYYLLMAKKDVDISRFTSDFTVIRV